MNFKHGLSDHPLYDIWNAMKQRCYNKNCKSYTNYGGRGIEICTEWYNAPKEFIEWALGNRYKKGLDIDRINNDNNYKPSNCRFVTASDNLRNRRIFNSTGVKHVYRHKDKYRVRKWQNSKVKNYGIFETLEEAKSVAKTI